MRFSFLFAAILVLSGNVYAAYDDSWYQTEFWSGEWPPGFSVIKEGVVVPARRGMSKEMPTTFNCPLPYKAVFHPWNDRRNQLSDVHYWTASKIVNMTVKDAFTFNNDEGVKIDMKPGEIIKYLIYGSEGSFLISIRGLEYVAYQELFNHVVSVPDKAFVEDRWLQLNCDNKMMWIYLNDLYDSKNEWIDGISGPGKGIKSYGVVEDLTDSDVKPKMTQ